MMGRKLGPASNHRFSETLHRRGSLKLTTVRTMRAIFTAALVMILFAGTTSAAEVGIASRYCDLNETASGRKVNCQDLVAAHRSLPFGKRVKVKNLANGRSVTVTIVDRGPFVKGRIIDLSAGAANMIGSADLMRVELVPQ